MTKKEATAVGRRDFFRQATLGAGAAGAAAIGLTAKESVAASPSQETGAGYQETDHVKKIYELSRF